MGKAKDRRRPGLTPLPVRSIATAPWLSQDDSSEILLNLVEL
jgi:hypothetical protein